MNTEEELRNVQRNRNPFLAPPADDAVKDEGDLTTTTGFVADSTDINGKRFVRFEVTFNIAAGAELPSPVTPRPQMNFMRLRFKY